jgi:ParB family transcriptional regulator, chromosome partitioning protein
VYALCCLNLISGHRRVQAAKEIGWEEIEGNVVNVSDSEALFLALKTNLMREDMNVREQGKVLHEMVTTFNLNTNQLAKKLGKNFEWVNGRILLAMNLNEDVAKALTDKKINQSVAEVIGTIDDSFQTNFLLYILENNIKNREGAFKAKKRFLNNTPSTPSASKAERQGRSKAQYST